jgi:hypothetical protein
MRYENEGNKQTAVAKKREERGSERKIVVNSSASV